MTCTGCDILHNKRSGPSPVMTQREDRRSLTLILILALTPTTITTSTMEYAHTSTKTQTNASVDTNMKTITYTGTMQTCGLEQTAMKKALLTNTCAHEL